MNLRKHQSDVAAAAERIACGESIRRIYVSVTPGGGKSAIPGIIADRLIGLKIDRILWVVPRNALRDQGERDFPEWSRFRIRAAGNELNPCRGTIGYVTTYQAIVADPARHLVNVSDGHRWAVLLDEFHHVLDGGEWFRALDPIVQQAALLVPMSGTLARGDGQPIAWLPYRDGLPMPEADTTAVVVRYSRSSALREGAIVPVHFRHLDGRAEWEDEQGELRKTESLAKTDYAAAALFTALRTEYAYQLLDECVADWRSHRKEIFANAKLLIVAPKIDLAEQYQDHLHRRKIDVLIATSDDSPAAAVSIARFKGLANPTADVLVTVGMAYEGLSVPAITHIACLTHIRSVPWLEQCFARANRTAPGKMAGFVYGPADSRFMEAINSIELEQASALQDAQCRFDTTGSVPEGEEVQGPGRPGIRPIGSQAYRSDGMEIEPPIELHDGGMTPRQAELLLRQQIARHIEIRLSKARSGSKSAYSKIIHAQLKELVGEKAREDCSVEELTRQWAFLKERWPV